ncbi:phospholipase [Paenibacillaceae bacterium]|nr:phospholipase [Paenibacillaceae bacterium]
MQAKGRANMTVKSNVFQQTIQVKTNMGYNLFIPDHYDAQKEWPIILFLHGIKRRGADPSMLNHYGLLKIAENSPDFNFLVLAPQCPALAYWPAVRHEVLALLDQVMADYRVDEKKVYLTGFSMGGHGAWDLAAHASHRFAAAAPLSGWFEKEAVDRIDVPIWAFHREDDDTVTIDGSIQMVEALQEAGKEVKFTSYPGIAHAIMEETYGNPDLFAWLLSKERSTRQ